MLSVLDMDERNPVETRRGGWKDDAEPFMRYANRMKGARLQNADPRTLSRQG